MIDKHHDTPSPYAWDGEYDAVVYYPENALFIALKRDKDYFCGQNCIGLYVSVDEYHCHFGGLGEFEFGWSPVAGLKCPLMRALKKDMKGGMVLVLKKEAPDEP